MRYDDVKPGQRVRVVRKVPNRFVGDDGREWLNSWCLEMDPYIGKSFIVDACSPTGITFKEDCRFDFPWAALELVDEVTTHARVTRPGQAYTTHTDWPKEFGLTRYARGLLPATDIDYKVIHHDAGLDVYALESPNGDQFLVGSEGVKLFKKPEENTIMSTTTTAPLFQTKTFINGHDAISYTAEDLIEIIRQAEGKIAELKAIKSKSEHIARQILTLQGQLAEVVRVLDGRQEGH